MTVVVRQHTSTGKPNRHNTNQNSLVPLSVIVNYRKQFGLSPSYFGNAVAMRTIPFDEPLTLPGTVRSLRSFVFIAEAPTHNTRQATAALNHMHTHIVYMRDPNSPRHPRRCSRPPRWPRPFPTPRGGRSWYARTYGCINHKLFFVRLRPYVYVSAPVPGLNIHTTSHTQHDNDDNDRSAAAAW